MRPFDDSLSMTPDERRAGIGKILAAGILRLHTRAVLTPPPASSSNAENTENRRIPKKHWQEMSGRQAKVLNEQAARYGLPLEGAYIDLTKLARALHDLLAKHAAKLAQEDDPMLRSANSSPAPERYREEKARLAQLDRLEREGTLITLDKACAVIDRLAVHVRQARELIARDYGQQAAEILIEAIERFQSEFRSAVTDKQPAP